MLKVVGAFKSPLVTCLVVMIGLLQIFHIQFMGVRSQPRL